jgi:predicted DsbA family dithiol-disulfide isomerase
VSSSASDALDSAVQLLQERGKISRAPQARFSGRSVFEEAIWQFRLAFFRDLRDVAARQCQIEIAQELNFPLDAIWDQVDNGSAFAAFCADLHAKEQHLIEGSPKFLLNDGRQKLYGNVGYRIIEANIDELMNEPGVRAS